MEICLPDLLREVYGENKYGVFLDFAVAEKYRGEGIGSGLFDLRLDRLVLGGAEVIVGRTIKTSPAQYFGNYLKRGMEELAFDPSNLDKAIFAVESTKIIKRLNNK
jgi:GNAT superfamily N-acetyltransferase